MDKPKSTIKPFSASSTTRSRPSSRAVSPEQYKLARSWKSISDEFHLQDRDPAFSGLDAPSFNSSISSMSVASFGPQNSEERLKMRATRSNSPIKEEFVEEVLRSPNSKHRATDSYYTNPPPQSSKSQRKRPDSRSNNAGYETIANLERIPNSTLSADVPFGNKTAILGSSQLVGCQGDFCHFNLHAMQTTASSAIVKKGKNKGQMDYQKALFQAGLLETGYETNKSQSLQADYRITYKSIIQARQEMPLVRQALDRHMRGEEGLYSLDDNYTDVTLGGKLAGYYHQEVPVCSNCFQVYTIIDRERAKAVAVRQKSADDRNLHSSKKRRGLGSTRNLDDSHSVATEFSSKEEVQEFFQGSLTSHQKETLSFLGGKKRLYSPTQSTVKAKDPMNNENYRNLQEAMKSIEGLTKLDVAEIRTMVKPPAAVEVVIEAVMILLTGKKMSFKESYRLLSGGEAFLVMLKEFNIDNVSDERLRLVEAYVDNPLFRPENVLPVSHCASKFCAWVHGIAHAARYKRGETHHRIDPMTSIVKANTEASLVSSVSEVPSFMKPLTKPKAPLITSSSLQGFPSRRIGTPEEELSFVQKLEKMKADKVREFPRISREEVPLGPIGGGKSGNLKGSKKKEQSAIHKSLDSGLLMESSLASSSLELPQSYKDTHKGERSINSRTLSKFDPRPSPNILDSSTNKDDHNTTSAEMKKAKISKRDKKALEAMQKKATDRLSAQTAIEGSVGIFGKPKEVRCSDGISRMPYIVMGKFSLLVDKCNFVVIHDFFDTYDGTSIFFKPIVQRHEEGCQFLCFNYPGQAHTVWPRLTPAEKERGAVEPIFNNDWIADRIHELLSHAEEAGDFLLSRPFHLVGIGNGACIAAAFCQKYAQHELYRDSLRSIVTINGFLYPDAQLSSILHAAHQVFESTPLNRPDIAVSYWSRFIFSEDYLAKVNPNLALNIYTAVSNPITNDGRVKITRGCLAHKDYRGGLSPDINARPVNNKDLSFATRFQPIQVPVVVLQSTENILVNASNVDNFLVGRNSKHLWSHMLNVPSEALRSQAFDVNAQWVGKMSTSSDTYAKFSTLGKQGIRMLFDAIRNPRGAFVMWARAGHIIQQEYKAAVLDLIDALACPTDEYVGFTAPPPSINTISTVPVIEEETLATSSNKGKVKDKEKTPELVFTLESKTEEGPMDTFELLSVGKPKISLDEIPVTANINEAIDNILRAAIPENPTSIKGSTPDKLHLEESPKSLPSTKSKSFSSSPPKAPTTDISSPHSTKSAEILIKPPEELKPFWDSKQISENSQPLPFSPEKKTDGVMDKSVIATRKQKTQKEWISNVPDVDSALALELELQKKQQEYLELEEKLRKIKASQQPEEVKQKGKAKEISLKKEIEEDEKLLKQLSSELEKRQKERIFSEKQRRLEMQEVEDDLVAKGLVEPYEGPVVSIPSPKLAPSPPHTRPQTPVDFIEASISPIKEVPPMHYERPKDLPKALTEGTDIISKLDQMVIDEQEARKRGELTVEEFESIKRQMAERQLERDQMLRQLSYEELEDLKNECTIQIQRIVRGFNSRNRAKRLDAERKLAKKKQQVSVHIQRVVRGFLGRRRFKRLRAIYLTNMKGFFCATQIQRVYRGYADRKYFHQLRRWINSIKVQRVFRGHLGRLAVKRERERLRILKRKHTAAAKIQSMWRMKVAKEEYRNLRIHILAAIEIQRVYRGYLGRKKMKRRRQWEMTKPGPERIKLGLQFIEESKAAFERQQEEIDALHRAQERAESRISHIHAELKESEKELVILERELQEIDQIERDLQILTHERQLLNAGIEDASGMPRTAKRGHKEIVMGKESNHDNDPMLERRRRAEAYALEMTIQLKRSEREKKRQELEIEFANVFQEVEMKKKALQRLELSLADMEATRERKDREFQRLQKNLMQLLLEQKQELDELREKGLELETATATTAAAAVATAQKAKEHEKRSHQMFTQTEELMKFQFMSMSLSYFSSLNMLKSLRDMNADTTSAAIALSADASSTAAAAASAANLPSVKKLTLGADDYIEASIRKKKEELLLAEKAKKEFQKVSSQPLPDNVRTWTVGDVSRWLDTLSLSQYVEAFMEGSVDGPFLMELREEDLIQVLGIKHKLHVRKILLSREKLKPLSQQEKQLKEAVEREEKADVAREEMGVPSLDAVFSQARNGRVKRVEESLNLGFQIDAEDEKGNTLLLIACQNSNKRLVEMLLLRGAKINHQNALGNTALHFAIAFDSEGAIAEYLIEHGADDTIENIQGLTPYDGVAS